MTAAPLRLALIHPEIPQNAGAMMRLCACLGVAMDIVEPCGFVLDDRRLRRAGMDYLEGLALTRHVSWAAFQSARPAGRLLLLTTRGSEPYHRVAFRPGDCLAVGSEGGGAPEAVHEAAALRLVIPMRAGMRSLNVALAAAMVLGEAVCQLGGPWDRPGLAPHPVQPG